MVKRAALFDLDGTLVDNMAFHAKAWVETATRLGVEAGPERFTRELAGMTNAQLFPLLLQSPVGPEELLALSELKEARYRELFAPHLRPLAGATELIVRLREAGVAIAVASAAPLANRDFVLDGLGLRGLID